MRAFFVGVAVAGAIAACSSVNDVQIAAKQSLDRHQALWGQRTFSSYSFDLSQLKSGSTTNVHITVNGTTIASVIDTSTGMPPVVDVGYPTIDDLFTRAQAAFGQKNTTLQMDFNEQYGYPTLLATNTTTSVEPYTATVSNFAVIP
jgi:Family of unknown function (DUF6174)